MTEDFKDIQEKPTLTLDPFQETAVPKAEFPAMQEEPEMDETVLSEEERQMAEQFAQQIDLTDSSMILQYGIGTQKKMADFSESALENVRTKDLGEIGNLLSGVVSELKNFDEEEEKEMCIRDRFRPAGCRNCFLSTSCCRRSCPYRLRRWPSSVTMRCLTPMS